MSNNALRLLLDFDALVTRDNAQSPVFLHRRDRNFALVCNEQNVEPTPERWLAHINHLSGGAPGESRSQKVLLFWQRCNAGFMLAGSLFGVLAMLGLLFYDGGQRINITFILGFVCLQLIFALVTTIQSVVGLQPFAKLLRLFQRVNPHSTENGTTNGTAKGIANKLLSVLLASAGQLGGLCFALSGLLTLLLMVVLQDLAFGWSTTLDTSAQTYHNILIVLATPWAWLWPAAVPDFSLVEATRFFRAGPANDPVNPAVWGQWWPFITMVWVSWAMLPRAILYVLSLFIIKRKVIRLLTYHPAMRALIRRMQTPTLSTGNEYNDAADMPHITKGLVLQAMPKANYVLCWAGAGDEGLPICISKNKSAIAKMGGKQSLAQDNQALMQFGSSLAKTSSKVVLLLTRGWEPPTGELEDLLKKAKDVWPENTHVTIVPLALSPENPPSAQQMQQWLRFANRVDTEFLSVSNVGEQASSQTTSNRGEPYE